jgi:hypothetical protein
MSAPEINSFYMWCASEEVQTAGYWSVDPPTGGGNSSTRFVALVPDYAKDPAVLAALPEVQALVAAARAALQWLDDDLGASSEAQPERQNLRAALAAWESGK